MIVKHIKIIICCCIYLVIISPAAWAMEGNYYGSVAVNSPAGLGNIDLAFHLVMDDNTGVFDPQNSYIILDKTILFPKTAGTDFGPFVKNGHLTASVFHLETRSFTGNISKKTVNRKLILDGHPQNETGDTITGTYTETISGYLPENIIVSGDFIMSRPISVTREKLTADLQSVIKVLQFCAGMNTALDKSDDINGNEKIDMAEAIYALQVAAGIRQ